MEEERLINPELENSGEERLENSLRPKTLDEYIGQDKQVWTGTGPGSKGTRQRAFVFVREDCRSIAGGHGSVGSCL